MREMIKMIVVLTVLSVFSGGLLAAIRNGTKDKIENQQLQFVKGPAISAILEGASNNPIADRFKLKDAETERSFFVGVFDGQADAVAFESFGKGFGGEPKTIKSSGSASPPTVKPPASAPAQNQIPLLRPNSRGLL